MYRNYMEPELRLKVALSKMGTQIKRAERNAKLMENRMKVAQRDLAQLTECVNVAKWQVEELKKTWGSVAKEVEDMREREKLEESLRDNDLEFDEIDVNERTDVIVEKMSEDGKDREGKKIEECVIEATPEKVKETQSKGGDDERMVEDGKKIEEDIMAATSEDGQRSESKGEGGIQEGTVEGQPLWS